MKNTCIITFILLAAAVYPVFGQTLDTMEFQAEAVKSYVNTADLRTNCDSQPKPALSCPSGYTMMCNPIGGDHWACGKESNRVIQWAPTPANEADSIYQNNQSNLDFIRRAPVSGTTETSGGETARELEPAVSTLAACQARCRDQYGGSGSAGYEACIRSCGAGGAARGAACPGNIAPACEVPNTPECRDGKWICVPPATGGSTGGGIIAPGGESEDNLKNFEPRLSTIIQVKSVEVRGWDPEKKKEFLESIKEHAQAKSSQDLENFARGVLLQDENAESVVIGEEGVRLNYRMPAKFLGIFNSSLTARIEVDSESRVKVKYPWFRFLFKNPLSVPDIQKSVEKGTEGVKQTMQTQVKLSSVGDDAQLANIDLQNKLQQQRQTLEMLSNVSKMLHDTALSVIRKMN